MGHVLGYTLGNTPFALLTPTMTALARKLRLRVHDDALISTTPRDAARTAAAKVLAVAEFVGSYER
jgi:hypothetical protein